MNKSTENRLGLRWRIIKINTIQKAIFVIEKQCLLNLNKSIKRTKTLIQFKLVFFLRTDN